MPLPAEASLIVVADLDTLGLIPGAIEKVPLATRTAKVSAAIDYVLAALGKRAKRPVTFVDDSLKESMVIRAYCMSLMSIGYGQKGADAKFDKAFNDNEAWLELVAKGLREPYFIDSTSSKDEHGPLGGTSDSADAWLDLYP